MLVMLPGQSGLGQVWLFRVWVMLLVILVLAKSGFLESDDTSWSLWCFVESDAGDASWSFWS